MKIIIAPDSFKESISAIKVSQIIKEGFINSFPDAEYVLLPIADGGEGTVDAVICGLGGEKINIKTTDPLGKPSHSFYGLFANNQIAVIEIAAASGLEKVPLSERNALKTTSYGSGELIKDALNRGVRHFIIGLGGSATNDGGAGMLQALGVKLLDKFNQEIGYGGKSLGDLVKIDLSNLDPRLADCQIQVACDVSNPLIGNRGASAIFGPQKGASAEDIIELDNNLEHFANLIEKELGIDVKYMQGAGAAGGMGAALVAFLGAELKSGINIMAELLKLDNFIKNADLVITGEGRFDSQSLNGKVPIGIAEIAKKHHKPTIVIAGSLGEGLEQAYPYGISAMFSILSKISTLEQALNTEQAERNLYYAAKNIGLTLKIGMAIENANF